MTHDVFVFPTSFAQRRLWFLDQMSGGRPVYNVATEIEFDWLVAPEHFDQALQLAVRRHESLRTTFAVVDGEPVQVVHPPASTTTTTTVDDLRALSSLEKEAEYSRIAAEVAGGSFDLTHGPLVCARLVWMDAASAVAILVMHHISTDGWSSRLLEEEILLACDALRRRSPINLPEVPIQYGDFAVWQRQQLAAGARDRIEWWRNTLKDAPAALSLPLDRARPPVASLDGTTLTFRLPARLSGDLHELCQRTGVTGFMATLAAFQFLLAQHCGAADIVVGTAVAGRDHPSLDRTIGFFVNTIVLRSRIRAPLTFASLLEQVRTAAMDAYAHQDLPFERLVAELAPDRQLAQTPLFQVMFTYDPIDVDDLEADDGEPADTLEIAAACEGTAKFDVTLALAESGSGLSGVLEFNADIFAETTMRTWLHHLHALLEHAVAHPDAPLTPAALLAESEREQVVNGWNHTATDYPRNASIPAIFDQTAARCPHAPAVVDRGATISYGELLLRSELMAAALEARGVRRGTLVGICAPRSGELIAGMLAVLKAGGAYVPLDPEYPVERLRMMVEDAGLSIVLAADDCAGALTGCPVTIVSLSTPGLMPDPVHPAVDPVGTAGPEDVAYVIYTSGSTGRPKGVAIPHRAVLRLVCETDYVALGPDDAVGHASNTSFDAATFEIWGALLNGARVVVIARELMLSPRDLVAFLRAEQVTTLFITTPLFNQIAAIDPGSFGSLRTLLFGGDTADPGSVRRVVRSASPPARLLHVYGPTETTTFATWHHVRDIPDTALTVPIGGPIANTEAYVLDADRQPVPVGIAGELYIGGDGVGLGYLGLADATRERFVANPLAGRSAGRLYRTGDRVRWLPDGSLEFLGRIDRQIKIRGFRVEPGEVEVLLARCPGVRQVAVVPKQNGAGRYLAAYVSALRETELSVGTLRQHARARLPDYMVPSHFVVMPDLPLTANGKIDRDALPGVDLAIEGAAAAFVNPRSDVERLLAGVWRDVLQLERVSVEDNFFDVGGHSLLLIKVLERLRALLPVELSVLDLFRFPTIATLAGEIAVRTAAAVPHHDPPSAARTSVVIDDRAALLRRGLSRHRPDARIPPEAPS
jgi:amino acid adenylation domain-containing protein